MRRIPLALVLSAALLLPTACGGGGDSGGGGGGSAASADDCPIGALDDASGKVKVPIWHMFTSLPRQTLEAQAKRYNASQDKVQVVPQFQGDFDELQAKVEAAAVDKTLPGLVTLEDTKTQWAADSGLFNPAQSCIDADPEVKKTYDDLLPIIKSSYELNDTLYPVSFSVFTALLYYNQDHFREAGLDPSKPPATFDEIYEAAKKIKAAKPDTKPLAFIAQPWIFEWIMSGVRQPIVNNSNGRKGLATKAELDSKPAVELLDLLQKMKAEGLADIIPASPGQVDHVLAMAQQQSSMTVETSGAASTIAGVLEGTIDAKRLKDELGVELPAGSDNFKLDLDIEAAPIPGLKEAGKGQVGGGVWYLPNTNSKEVQAGAWDFVQWLNQPEQQAEWAAQGSSVPAFASTAEVPSLQKAWSTGLGGKWQKVSFDVLENGVDASFPGPVIGPYTETRSAIRKALDQALLDGKDPSKALAAADQTVDKELALYKEDVGG